MPVRPTQNQIAHLVSAGPDGAIVMVNLLKYRTAAAYETSKPEAKENLSGRDAYLRYGVHVQQILSRIGAAIVWQGHQACVMIGEGNDWDDVVCVRYPSRQTFLQMAMSADYNDIAYHRDAALENTVLLCCEAGSAA